MGCASSAEAALAQDKARQLAVEIGALREGQKLDIRSVVMLMWKARTNPKLVHIITNLVETHADEKDVFDGIEFYLPQLVHMILHLEAVWKTRFLEQFALLIAQQSLHFALNMYWILVAALQDYQPEDDEGMPNPTFNAELYVRCAALQQNLEKAVVFGSPRCAEYEQQFLKGQITKVQLQDLEIKDRGEAAASFVKGGEDQTSKMGGTLMFKRWVRTSRFAPKGWSKKRFEIRHRILICYDVNGSTMLRALPLAHAEVKTDIENAKYEHYFEVQEKSRARVWKLRASSQYELKMWVDLIRNEAHAPPLSVDRGQTLTETQIARYGFYRSERDFVRDLTDICEDLRFVPVPERKTALKEHSLKLDIPGCVYLPMTKSTAQWFRVLKINPEKGHPFSTKARCPCLMTFEVINDGDVDLANYLYQTLDQGSVESADQQTFVQSARKSATDLPPEALGKSQEGSQLTYSDANASGSSSDHSIWAGELRPMASNREDSKKSASQRKDKHKEIYTEAVSTLKQWAGGLVSVDEGETGVSEPVEGPDSISNAFRLATEEDVRTISTRIKSMEGKANPNQSTEDRIIAKSNDDLRQEVFIMQLIQFLKDSWAEEKIPLYLRTYRILSTSKSTGIIEVITNADSIDGILKKLREKKPKARFIEKFQELFPNPLDFKQFQRRYMESLAGTSLMNYILRIGDRHNGNIMVELESGRLAHIDFGFVLGMRPGKDKVPYTDFSFERYAFKITSEMIEIIDGKGSELWFDFIQMMADGLLAIRKRHDVLITMIEIMGHKSILPCFNQPGGGTKRVIAELKSRLMLNLSDSQVRKRMEKLTNNAYQAFGTIMYEKFQRATNKLEPIF